MYIYTSYIIYVYIYIHTHTHTHTHTCPRKILEAAHTLSMREVAIRCCIPVPVCRDHHEIVV